MKSSPDSAHEHDAPFHPTCPHCRYDLVTLPDGPCPECGTPFTLIELRGTWLRRHRPYSGDDLLSGFIPLCPRCKYDLFGIADGPCPECGRPFTAGELQARFIEPRVRRDRFALRLLVAIPTVAGLVIWGSSLIAPCAYDRAACWAVGAFSAALSAAWMWLARAQLLVRRPFYLLVFLLFTLPACMAASSNLFWFGLLLPLPCIVGTLLAWRISPHRHRLVPIILFTFALLPPGLLGFVGGGLGWIHHEHWSTVDHLLPTSLGDWPNGRRPLSNPLVCLIGTLFIAAIGLGWLWTLRLKRPTIAPTRLVATISATPPSPPPPQQTPSSGHALDPNLCGFVPHCPTCRYDLSTLPDGPCPECGTPFNLDALKLAYAQRWKPDWRAASGAAVWTFCWFVVALILKIMLDRGPLEPHAGEIIFLWVWVSFGWLIRREIATAPVATFALTFVPAVACTVAASHIEPTEINPLGFARVPILLFAGLTALLLLWATVPARRARCIGSAWTGAICGFGIPVTLVALQDLANQRTWSPWPDLRWWQPYINYPFTNQEAAWIGAAITVLGATVALIPLFLARRHSDRRTAPLTSPPPSPALTQSPSPPPSSCPCPPGSAPPSPPPSAAR